MSSHLSDRSYSTQFQVSSVQQVPESDFQAHYDQINLQIKENIEQLDDTKDIFKKFANALDSFSINIGDISKKDKASKQGSCIEQLNQTLFTYIGVFGENIKHLAQFSQRLFEQVKESIEETKKFKSQSSKNFESQMKQYQKLKKEFQQSRDKLDLIKFKLDDFRKQDVRNDPQYNIIKHEYKFQKHEVDARHKNKLDCNQAFFKFMIILTSSKDKVFQNNLTHVSDSILKLNQLFKDTFQQLQIKYYYLIQINRFDNFAKPMIQEILNRMSEMTYASQQKCNSLEKSSNTILGDLSQNQTYINHQSGSRSQISFSKKNSSNNLSRNISPISRVDQRTPRQSIHGQQGSHLNLINLDKVNLNKVNKQRSNSNTKYENQIQKQSRNNTQNTDPFDSNSQNKNIQISTKNSSKDLLKDQVECFYYPQNNRQKHSPFKTQRQDTSQSRISDYQSVNEMNVSKKICKHQSSRYSKKQSSEENSSCQFTDRQYQNETEGSRLVNNYKKQLR